MASFRIAGKTDLEPGERRIVEAGGREVALFNVDGTFHAIENTCCHRGGPLGDGEVNGNVVACPWHGWEFDVTTGKCAAPDPTQSVEVFAVRVEGDDVHVDLG